MLKDNNQFIEQAYSKNLEELKFQYEHLRVQLSERENREWAIKF